MKIKDIRKQKILTYSRRPGDPEGAPVPRVAPSPSAPVVAAAPSVVVPASPEFPEVHRHAGEVIGYLLWAVHQSVSGFITVFQLKLKSPSQQIVKLTGDGTGLLGEGGAVPAAKLELELALLDGVERAQTHAVHEHGVPLAEVDLKEVSYRIRRQLSDHLLLTYIWGFRHCCQGDLPTLPDFHLPEQNRTDNNISARYKRNLGLRVSA